MESLIDNLNDGKKIVAVTYDVDRLKNMSLKDKKVKLYDNLKRMYSFKSDITIIELHENYEFSDMEVKIMSILFKSVVRQKVDIVYVPKKFKNMLSKYHEFTKYREVIKYI